MSGIRPTITEEWLVCDYVQKYLEWSRQRFGDRLVDEKIENKTIEVDDGSKTKN